MKRLILGIFLGLSLSFLVSLYADRVSSPPPLQGKYEDSKSVIQHYLKELSINIHRLEVTTVNPDGSRRGKKGDMVLLQTGGKHYLEINTDSSTTWHGEELTDVP